jgi:RNA polymerase sigma-32 factor
VWVKKIQKGLRNPYVVAINKLPKLTEEKQLELFDLWKRNGDLVARKRLIEANLGIAAALAIKHGKRQEDFEDLISEGAIGVMQALDKYDPQLGSFRSYAWHWVRARVYAQILRNWRIYRGTSALHGRVFFRLRNSYSKACCLTNDRSEILRRVAEDLEVDEATAEEWLGHVVGEAELPLNSPVRHGTHRSQVQDAIRSPEVKSEDMSEQLHSAIESLTPRARHIMSELADRDTTQTEIAKSLGVSRQAVEQVHKRACAKIKKLFCEDQAAA